MPLTWVPLPETSVWALPVADTRSALSTVLLRADGEGLAIDAALGADFPIVGASFGEVELQVGLLAATFMAFGAGGELTFDLITFDGRFGLPLDLRAGPWSARVEWVHVSAHYGDGVRSQGELPQNLNAYSREFMNVYGSRDFTVPDVLEARLLLGGHALLHAEPEAAPWAIQVAGEVRGPWAITPYLAADLQAAQEHNFRPALAVQAGMEAASGPRRFRLAFAARLGPDEAGKTAGEEDRWVGLIFGFDATGRIRD